MVDYELEDIVADNVGPCIMYPTFSADNSYQSCTGGISR